ncbi:hypothetical protein SAMN02744775_02233 [Enterobacter sp. CC120223-11]|nr:hypothetical protein SAMN02744775_02233 [Enterobacter sp. CC120223-11]
MEHDHPSAESIIALYHEGAEAWASRCITRALLMTNIDSYWQTTVLGW